MKVNILFIGEDSKFKSERVKKCNLVWISQYTINNEEI